MGIFFYFCIRMSRQPITIESVQCWDESALQMLYNHYYKAMVNYAFQLTQDQEESKDIVQDVFFNLWEKSKNMCFENISQLKVYLYNSVRFQCISYLRHQQVVNNHQKQIIEHTKEMSLDADKEEKLYKEEVYRQLFLEIENLPVRQREIFMEIMKGKKNHEIAAALKISVNTVKSHRLKGMQTLKKKLDNDTYMLLVLIVNLV